MKKDIIINHADLLTSGRISRRKFIMTAIAAGATLPMAMTMAGNAMAATPVKGGRLRQGLGYGSTTDSLDPGTSENGFTQALHYTYGNQLTEVGSDGNLIPELAESFEPSNGAKTWTFKLRNGVEFHNGKTLTAVSDYHLVIQPSKDGAIDALSGIGTGGYILENFEPGVRAVSKRNPNYFKENSAHFDEIELLSILDVTARQNAIMNGDADVIDNVDPKTVSLLSRAPNLTILETTGTQHFTFPMRLDVEPFANKDLRLALKYAIKRQELVDKILLGHGVVCACYWGGRPTQDWMYSSGYTAETEWNDTAWKETDEAKQFNDLVVSARSETDDNKRKADYFEAQRLLQDDGGAIVAMWANYIHAHSNEITHGESVAANWINDGNKIAERWWFA